jgi:ribosomal protein RSM22 (predicted rRNA methylase)
LTSHDVDSDKHQLRYDAKRLFQDPEGSQEESRWEPRYDVKYRSRRQTARHSERDATAFAAVALPAQYAAIYSVLDHVKTRLGPDWKVENVIDWGVGTGSGIWCAHTHTPI